jgi:hypothetical protein
MSTPRPAQTLEEIEAEIKACREKLANMWLSLEKQKIWAHIARLRLRANAKRWFSRETKPHRPF